MLTCDEHRTSISKGNLGLNGGIESFHHKVALSPWTCPPAFLSHCIWSVKWIRLDDLQSPLKLEHSMILLPWDLIGFEMGCCKGWRHKERVILPWHNAGCRCLARTPSLMSAFYQGAFVLSPGFAWPLHQSPFCSSWFGTEPVDVETPRQDFFPRAAWMVKLTNSREISCFVFHKLKQLLITKHTLTQKQKHIHKQNRMFSLLSLLQSKQSLTIWVTFTRGPGFHQSSIKPLVLAGDVTES